MMPFRERSLQSAENFSVGRIFMTAEQRRLKNGPMIHTTRTIAGRLSGFVDRQELPVRGNGRICRCRKVVESGLVARIDFRRRASEVLASAVSPSFTKGALCARLFW